MNESDAQKCYETLCRTLEKNDIRYKCDSKSLCVRCSISGRDIEQHYAFSIDPSKMLITLYCEVPVRISREAICDIAFALCMINNAIPDGSFCIDLNEAILYFKMTVSFFSSAVSDQIYLYMLSAAADTIDRYYPGLSRISAQAYRTA